MLHFTKRVLKMVTGFALLGAGVVMLVTPGPGWLTIFGGLAILASEFKWARHLMDLLKARFRQFRDAAFRAESKKKPAAAPESHPDA